MHYDRYEISLRTRLEVLCLSLGIVSPNIGILLFEALLCADMRTDINTSSCASGKHKSMTKME